MAQAAGRRRTACRSRSATTISRSTAGAARASRTCSSSAATIRACSCSAWSRTTAPPATSSRPPTRSSRNNNGRLGKNLWTSGEQGEPVKLYAAFNERDEADFVINRIREWTHKGGRRSDCAILYRSNAQSRAFEEALLTARIPYRVYGGLRFFERAEIKDALAYLRLIFSRADDASFERVVNLPARGIGAKTLDTMRNYARANACSMWEAAGACIAGARRAHGGQSLHGFMLLIEQLDKQTRALPLHEQVDHVINASGLVAHYQQEQGDRGEARVENLNELVSAARGYEPDAETRGCRRSRASSRTPCSNPAKTRRTRGKTACR